MAQEIDLKIRGLYTHPNEFSEVPEGALAIADNIVIDRESIAEVRRGQKQYGNVFVVGSGEINKMFTYKNRILVHYDTKLAYDSNGAGNWTNYSGTYNAPASGFKIHSFKSNQNFFFTTDEGIKKLDTLTSTPVAAGAPRGLDGEAALTGASGFMPNTSQIAYRIVWGYKDANNNLILGSPSQRIVISNSTGGTRDVNVTFTIPDGITTSWFYQIYRSASSSGTAVEPNDELYLVYENNPTSGEITAKSVTVTDNVPEDLTGAALYTSPSQSGISEANEVPPFAKDVDIFKNHALYANIKTKHRLYITLIAVGGTSGILVNDTITLAGVTYTGKVAENVGADEFLVATAGTPSQNIDDTARSLVKVINQSPSTTDIYAYYVSGYDDLPGQILLEERTLGGASFSATSSQGAAYSPVLPVSGTTVSSDNEEKQNRLYVSKLSQPEAVPLLNYLDIGSADSAILRVLALRESAFVFKEDGIYRITGTTFSNFSVDLFDNTAEIKAAESAVVFNNQVFMFSDQGIVAVSDGGGVAVVSRPIENTLLQLSASQYTNFASVTHAVAYESDRKYVLFTVTETTDTYPTQAFVYNAFTGGWTRWVMSRSTGLVNPADDKLYLANPVNDFVYQERKDFDLNDYADEEVDITLISYSGYELTLFTTNGLTAGMTVKQGILESRIVSVDSSTVITVENNYVWTAFSTVTVYTPIEAKLEWTPQYGGNPSALKQYPEVTFLFDDANFNTVTATFQGSFSTAQYSVTLTSQLGNAWGAFPWGTIPWDALQSVAQSIRTYVPLNVQRTNWLKVRLTLNQAFRRFGVAGLSMTFRPMSTRYR